MFIDANMQEMGLQLFLEKNCEWETTLDIGFLLFTSQTFIFKWDTFYGGM